MQRAGIGVRDLAALRVCLLDWYRDNRRDLPWRHTSDPYAIWLSEIMLQQTRVAAVVERYRLFFRNFPTVADLAQAEEQQVLALWSGLGYYRRARMLHQAAKKVVDEHSSRLPSTAAGLRKLPGIGAYTAAAIASIAHGEASAVVDGNVERVLSRLSGRNALDSGSVARHRKAIEEMAVRLLDPVHPGEFNQAMMELGAMVCTPRSPRCPQCPFLSFCPTRGEHPTLPKPKMQSREIARALVLRQRKTANGPERQLLLEQRPESANLLPGMWQLPELAEARVPDALTELEVRHAILQVNYRVRIRRVLEKELDRLTVVTGRRRWVALDAAASMALTGLARKVLTRLKLIAPIAAPHASGVR